MNIDYKRARAGKGGRQARLGFFPATALDTTRKTLGLIADGGIVMLPG